MREQAGMTALAFQDELCKKIEDILKDVQTRNTAGDKVSGVTAYKQWLPIVTADDEDESQFFPFAIVRLMDGTTPDDDTPWLVSVTIILGVHDTNTTGIGYQHISVMIQRIIDEFAAEPLLARMFRAQPDVTWALQDEDTYPFYYGSLKMTFNLPKIARREPIYG